MEVEFGPQESRPIHPPPGWTPPPPKPDWALFDLRPEDVTRDNYAAIAASAYAEAGSKEEAIAIMNRLLKERDTHYVDPSKIAMIYAALRDEANALEWLQRGVNEKSAGTPYTRVFPMFKFLRDNPRFREISKKIGLG